MIVPLGQARPRRHLRLQHRRVGVATRATTSIIRTERRIGHVKRLLGVLPERAQPKAEIYSGGLAVSSASQPTVPLLQR
jgi:hypothetical protein